MTEEVKEVATASAEPSGPAEVSDADRGGNGEGAISTSQARRRRRSRGRGRGRPSQAGAASGAEGSPDETGAGSDRSTQVAQRVRAAAEVFGPTANERRKSEPRVDQVGTTQATAAEAEPAGKPERGDDSAGEPGSTSAATPRRRRRGGRGRSRATRPAGAAEDQEASEPSEPAAEAREAPKPRTTGTRRSRPAPSSRAKREEADSAADGGAYPADAGDEAAPPRTASRRRRKPAGSGAEKADADTTGTKAASASTGTRRRRTTSTAAREPKSAEAVAEEADGESSRPTRTRKTRLPGRRRREPQPVIARNADKTMLITELGERDQIAVLEDRTLVEHYITRSGAKSMVGNIYLGKVQNVLPGMEAAFIDVGRGRNAVLYAGEVSYDEEIDGEHPRIEHVLKAGQNVLVQVTKDPMGGKGARLTQEISLPGRYLVLVPNSQVFGISRRLPDKERQRLKDLLKQVRPPEHGVIVRTAAEGASEEDLRKDLERLIAEWEVIDKSRKRGKSPRVLYEEPELTVRVVRDMFNEGEFKDIVTDSEPLFRRVTDYLQSVAPELVSKVRMHTGPLPVLEAYHALEQIHKALDRKVWLPSGGYIVVDKTEAMTVVDVNTGKHVGKANLEETVTKTNTEAAEEVARQLRLRDIGGIIIIDFIDMMFERNKDKVISTLKNSLAQDKTRSQVFDIGPLGLLEVTRKRVSAGLLESFSETCPTCEGRGILLTHKL